MLLGKHKLIVDQNHLTGEQSVPVKLIDFVHADQNRFNAINQFRIDTPGMGKGFIIPNIALFVNGLPLVVVECKVQNEFTANPLDEAVKRSQRKTLSIYLERDGTISVLAPESFTDAEIHTIVTRKSFQLYKHLAEREELNAPRSLREIVSGETFLYLGRNYRLQLVDDQPVPLLLKEGYFCLKRADKAKAPELFKDFYWAKRVLRITKRIRHFQGQMGVETAQIRVMDLQHRWASCSTLTGDLNFHWKCMMAPLAILYYIIVHELAHLKYDTHSEAFWNEVDKILPDHRERKSWLRFNGAGMDL